MLARLFGQREEVRAQATDWGEWPGDSMSVWSGMRVDSATSLQLLAVYGSVRLISDQISTLPIDTYRELSDGSRVEIPKPGWLAEPTVDLTFAEWCSQVLSSLLLAGNAYVKVARGERGGIVELVPLDPAVVQVSREGGRKVYRVNGVPYGYEMVHIKGLMLPGSDVGLSPVEAARQSIGLGLATMEYGAKFFDGEGNMPGVIEIPSKAQPDEMKSMADMWRRKRSRAGKGLPGVLQGGATWKPTGVTNEQAQFLATRQYTAAEIAGQMFLLDPSDLGINSGQGSTLTYANLEQRSARRIQVALLPWMVRIEKAISALLYEPRYMKFNVEGLLRGDTLNRFQAYALAETINATASARGEAPLLLTSEMREREDLPPLPDPPPMPAPSEEPTDANV